jgi:hypothetical protein
MGLHVRLYARQHLEKQQQQKRTTKTKQKITAKEHALNISIQFAN